MKKTFKALFQIIIVIVLLAIITPVVYFAWRMGQPMDLREFNGLTYYQVREWKKMATEDLIGKYEAAHPNQEDKGPINRMFACTGGDIPIAFFVSVRSVTVAWQSEQLRSQLVDQGMPDEPVTISNFLPSLWNTYEKITLSNIKHIPNGPVVYCRIRPDIPTLEEFETMKHEHNLSTSEKSQVKP